MNLNPESLFQALVVASIIGFGADHFRLRSSLSEFKTYVAQHYASKPDVAEVRTAVEKVDSRVEAMMALLYEIKGQMGAIGHDGSR